MLTVFSRGSQNLENTKIVNAWVNEIKTTQYFLRKNGESPTPKNERLLSGCALSTPQGARHAFFLYSFIHSLPRIHSSRSNLRRGAQCRRGRLGPARRRLPPRGEQG